MERSRFTNSEIIVILKQAEAGSLGAELYREHCISNAMFFKCRFKFGGMDASLIARMKELEEENRRFKKMYVEERLKAEIVVEVKFSLPSGRVIRSLDRIIKWSSKSEAIRYDIGPEYPAQ